MSQSSVVIDSTVYPCDEIDFDESVEISNLGNGKIGIKLPDASEYILSLVQVSKSVVKITLVPKTGATTEGATT